MHIVALEQFKAFCRQNLWSHVHIMRTVHSNWVVWINFEVSSIINEAEPKCVKEFEAFANNS